MTPKNRTLEGKNRTLGGDGGVKNRLTSLMDDPLSTAYHYHTNGIRVCAEKLLFWVSIDLK